MSLYDTIQLKIKSLVGLDKDQYFIKGQLASKTMRESDVSGSLLSPIPSLMTRLIDRIFEIIIFIIDFLMKNLAELAIWLVSQAITPKNTRSIITPFTSYFIFIINFTLLNAWLLSLLVIPIPSMVITNFISGLIDCIYYIGKGIYGSILSLFDNSEQRNIFADFQSAAFSLIGPIFDLANLFMLPFKKSTQSELDPRETYDQIMRLLPPTFKPSTSKNPNKEQAPAPEPESIQPGKAEEERPEASLEIPGTHPR